MPVKQAGASCLVASCKQAVHALLLLTANPSPLPAAQAFFVTMDIPKLRGALRFELVPLLRRVHEPMHEP